MQDDLRFLEGSHMAGPIKLSEGLEGRWETKKKITLFGYKQI